MQFACPVCPHGARRGCLLPSSSIRNILELTLRLCGDSVLNIRMFPCSGGNYFCYVTQSEVELLCSTIRKWRLEIVKYYIGRTSTRIPYILQLRTKSHAWSIGSEVFI